MVVYHDREWGVPSRDDRHLFEMLTLEGAQAGLSWLTILRKRAGYRAAFADFYPAIVSQYTEPDVDRLMGDPGIVRNGAKIRSTIRNARAVGRIQIEYGSFHAFIAEVLPECPIQNAFETLADVPARTRLSDRLSKELAEQGFTFVGSTICYAFMQAVGLANDHLVSCYRHPVVPKLALRTDRHSL
jgi:DNA-3-methyladenine glycosylase I